MMLTADEAAAEHQALLCLEDELADVCGQLNALNARLVELTGEALDADAWAQWGIHTPSHWLAWKAGLSSAQARTIVRLAARRHELPVTMAAFAAGELSVDQVAPIAAKVPAWADAQVCELAKLATVTQLRSVVAAYPFEAEVPPAEDPAGTQTRGPEVFVSLTPRDDGYYRLSGLLDHDHGLAVDAALREARDALTTTSNDGPASNLDALVEIAHRSLDTVGSTARRDRYRIHLHLDTTGACTDAQGRHVPDWVRRLAGCDTTTSTTWETNGRPIAVGPPHTDIPAVLRRHVLRRDATCRVPGCHSRLVDIHHVIHRDDGGNHDPANLAAICPRHHRMHHRGHLGITGDAETPHALTFTDRHGRPLPPAPRPRPPSTAPPTPASRYRHPLGEPLQRWAVTFNPPRGTPLDTP